MYIVVSSNGADLDAQASPVFGRCPYFIFCGDRDFSFRSRGKPGPGLRRQGGSTGGPVHHRKRCPGRRMPTAGGATAPEHAGMGRGMAHRAAVADPSREEEIARLKQAAADLRQRLAEIVERLEQLEKGTEK